MLGLGGKEFERDGRFASTLPLVAEKGDIEESSVQTTPKQSSSARFINKYRSLPLLSKLISGLACIWIVFTSMRFVHSRISGSHGHGMRKWHRGGDDYSEGFHPMEEPVAIDITFTATALDFEGPSISKTSRPIYLEPFQLLDVSWGQGVKGSLFVKRDDGIEGDQPFIVIETADDVDDVRLESSVEASAAPDRLTFRFTNSESADNVEHIYNAVLNIPSSFKEVPPISIRGAEASLNVAQGLEHAKFSFLEIDTLVSEFKSDTLNVGVLRVNSGTGDISGTFNVSHELDLRTSTGNISAKVFLDAPHCPPGGHHGPDHHGKHHKKGDKHGKHHKHGKHGKHHKHDEKRANGLIKRWFQDSEEQELEVSLEDFELIDDDSFDIEKQYSDHGPPGPPPPSHHHGDHRAPFPPPPHHPGGDRRPHFPPHAPGHDEHKHGHHHPPPPPMVRVRALSSTGGIDLTYLNHLEHAALISFVHSDTGKVQVELAEEYKGKFKIGVKVGQVVIADEREKTVIIDREVKTPTGAFIEGFVKPKGNDTDAPPKHDDDRPLHEDSRFDVEREFDLARMMSGPGPMGPRGPAFMHREGRPERREMKKRGFFDFGKFPPPPPHGHPEGPHGPPPHGPPHGHFPRLPPPGFGFSAAFSIVGEVKLII